MDNTSELVEKFEEIFEQNSRRASRLYSSSKNENKCCVYNIKEYNPKDVICNISAQIKAIQNADCVVKSKGVHRVLQKHTTCSFLPVNMLQTPEVSHKKSAKFETQFVLDTQLMNVIEDVEAMSSHKGITQEFETSFDDSDIDEVDNRLKLPENKTTNKDNRDPKKPPNVIVNNERNGNVSDFSKCSHLKVVSQNNDVKIINENVLPDTKILLDDNCTALLDECMEVEENMNIQDVISGIDINPSPIININNGNKSKSTSPLIYNLDSFEKFEKLAVPIIEENEDIDTVKHLINSQILGKELFLQTDFEPEFGTTEDNQSPVLKISKTPKLNTDKQDITSDKLVTTLDFLDDNMNYPKKEDSLQSSHTLDILTTAKRRSINEQEMNSKNLEDEILFSSDEEFDIKQTELQDLPLTCALETSFYEHSDVLDKTMYVGFQTASNKSIRVLSASFTKAKSILDDETDCINVPTLKDLVEKCDIIPQQVSITNNNIKNTNRSSSDDDTKEIDLDFDITMAKDTKLVGFKTANGKPIDILNENMDKAKTLFNDIDKNEPIKDIPQCSSKFDGFKTASNKNIPLSEKALTSYKRVFQDIDLENNYCNDNLLPEIKSCSKRMKLSLGIDKCTNNNVEKETHEADIARIDDDILQEFEGEMSFIDCKDDKRDNYILGFKTASNKTIKISENALLKSKMILDDLDFQDKSGKNAGTDNMTSCSKVDNRFTKHPNIGFKTASNKIISISDEALAKTKNIFQDINISNAETITEYADNKINQSINCDSAFVGFKTASNKKIKVSEDAIAKTKNMFQDIEKIDMCKTLNPTQNNDVKNTTDMPNKNAVEHIDINKPSKSKESVGFKTAKNNKITISAGALAKTKHIFKDLNDVQPDYNKQKHITKFIQPTSKANELDINLETDNQENVSNFKENTCAINMYAGFQTASNKPVKISNDAFTKSKIVFQDILNDKDVMGGSFEKFHGESNSKVQIPAVLAKDKQTLQDLNKAKEPSAFHGFQTASNKEVKISAEALAKSRMIFDDLDKVNNESDKVKSSANMKPVFKGFQTASNKEVKISFEALARSRKLFEDLEPVIESCAIIPVTSNSDFHSDDKCYKDTCFVGFQTASNKEVKISAAALEKSKNVFKDIDAVEENDFEVSKSNTNPVFSGFHTANNKEVGVSSDALAKSKKLFEDLQENNAAVNIKTLSHKNGNDKISTGFKGFQSAGNKKVDISADALAKSRKIFQDLSSYKENESDLLESNKQSNDFKGFKTANNKNVAVSEEALRRGRQIRSDVETNESIKDITSAFSFKTANNNNIRISEEALLKSKQLFTEFNHNEDNVSNLGMITKIITDNSNVNKVKLDYNIDKLIDTQVIKNFDESLNTEDFRSPENRSKRSGSPILSCPKAKKRKFSTPYRKGNLQHTPESLIKNIEIYDNDYKKNKMYTLKDLEKLENSNTETEMTTDMILDDIQIDNFEFTDKRNDISDSTLSIDVLKVHFLKAVNKKLVPDGWFENHIKLILWKLLSYEKRFPKTMFGVCTAKNVLDQLKYRYFKELYNAERPALRKILERDDVASKTLILCVMDVYKDSDEKSGANQTELLLTDGWYSIRACIDKMLIKYVNNGKIKIGTKIITNGAELLNCEQGLAPWEDTSSVRLKIFGNSTRRARWDARLGYHGNAAILSHLSAIKPEGGKIAKLRVIVTRVYPALYVEKFEDGSTVTRSERLEHIHQMKYEADRQALVEKVYEEVEKDMSDEDSPDTEDLDFAKRSLDSGSQIARMLKISKEPSQFRANLTDSQRRLLEAYLSSKQDKILQNIQEKIRSKLSTLNRNVVPLLKVRVAEVQDEKIHNALLSIWKPNDALSELTTEGASIEILNVVPTAIRYSELQLSAGRQTIFKQTSKQTRNKQPYIKSLNRICYSIKELVTHPCMVTDYNEIDTIGMVIQIDPSHEEFKSINQFQNVYLADEEKNIICVNFWGGIKKFGFENVLDTGQVVACVNLQKRAGNTRKNIPQYRATEYTYFTKTPKSVDARKFIDVLSKKVLKNNRFVDECLVAKNNLKNNGFTENVSPYRFQNHDLTKSKLYIESPLARVQKDEFNLSGLDFESTFRQTEPQELSPKSKLRKKQVNERISKLKMYGEPPPLIPINIINKSKNATKSFKSPLLNSSVAIKTPVASAKMLPENTGLNELSCSPVLSVHRTLKRGVNPVKLNFNNVAIEENDNVDHFAEEFDPSPPLSLD